MTPALVAISVTGTIVPVLLLLVLHATRHDLDPRYRYVSEYVLGPRGRLMVAAFFVLAAGGTALGVALLRGASNPVEVGAAILLLAWSAGLALAGWFPTDPSVGDAPPTPTGDWHNRGARWAFQAIVGAATFRSLAALAIDDWSPVELAASCLLVVGYLAMTRGYRLIPVGVSQRAFLVSAVVWLLVTGWSI